MPDYRPTIAKIDLQALRHNVATLKNRARGAWFCPMVKADAYGHGLVEVTRAVADLPVDAFGVALVEEGIRLRSSGITTTVLVFGWLNEQAAAAIVQHALTPVLSRWQDLETFARKAPRGYGVHLKFNTGMNRLGFHSQESEKVARVVAEHGFRVLGIASHLAHGVDWLNSNGESAKQAKILQTVSASFPDLRCVHLVNSAALLSGGDLFNFGVRPGIAIYGAGGGAREAGLRPVMTFQSEIGALHKVSCGEGVSYDFEWRAKKDNSLVAVVPVGYADGLVRLLSNRGQVIVGGQRVPIVGIVCMDYIIVDVSDLKEAVEIGEPVTLWGRQGDTLLSVDESAGLAQTIGYELLTGVSARVPRLYVS